MKKKSWASSLYILLAIIYLLIPLAATAIYSMFQKWTGKLPEGFTLTNYIELLTERDFMLSLGRTIVICIVPIALTVLLVLLETIGEFLS